MTATTTIIAVEADETPTALHYHREEAETRSAGAVDPAAAEVLAGAAALVEAAAPVETPEEAAAEAAKRQTDQKGDALMEEAGFVSAALMWQTIANGQRQKEEEKKEIEMVKNFVKKKEIYSTN